MTCIRLVLYLALTVWFESGTWMVIVRGGCDRVLGLRKVCWVMIKEGRGCLGY
jgi:hypothetical protein